MTTKAGFNERYTGKAPVETDKQSECLEFYKDVCPKCGAKRIDSQIGLEKTPEAYVENLVKVFHEAKRILKKDGTFWLNMGDSYTGGGRGGKGQCGKGGIKEKRYEKGCKIGLPTGKIGKLSSKNLLMMPFRLAFALQKDGWILRSDIIWNKPNPMPESIKDRPTKSYEHVFLFAKNKKYFYDAEAIKEPVLEASLERVKKGFNGKIIEGRNSPQKTEVLGTRFASKTGRNKRDVWTITTTPFRGSHFATFPPKLITPMILAGCPEFVCNKCRKARIRIIEKEGRDETKIKYKDWRAIGWEKDEKGNAKDTGNPIQATNPPAIKTKTIGYTSCGCEAGFSGGIVLDPFMGAGTTGLVAKQLNRNYVGIELNPEYIKMAEARIAAPVKPEKKKRLSYKKALATIQESLFPE